MRHVIIVGYGMAGARLAEEIRRRDPLGTRVRLTILGEEPHPAYNRILLANVVAGTMSADTVRLHDTDWALRHRADVRTGAVVESVDCGAREVLLDDGTRLAYDDLVLATGASAWLPPIEGLSTADGLPAERVAVFRTLDDANRIDDLVRGSSRAVVLGGGLLGLEAARTLVARGLDVTVVHPAEFVMDRQIDAEAGDILRRVLSGLSVDIRVNQRAVRWEPGVGLHTEDGLIEADLLVAATGVRARIGLARDAGLVTKQGIVVDDRMSTSDSAVHAIGDCAEHSGTVSGLVQPAWDQAMVLADLLTGADDAARYRGTPVVTRLKARDVDLSALGEVQPTDDHAEVLRFCDPTRGRYAKLVLRDDRVTGAILLGAPDAAATIVQLFDQGVPAPSDRLALLLGRALPGESVPVTSPVHLPAAAVLCRCNTVTKAQLTTAWQAGARDVPAMARATRATTGCGTCVDAIEGICAWLAESDPDVSTEEVVA